MLFWNDWYGIKIQNYHYYYYWKCSKKIHKVNTKNSEFGRWVIKIDLNENKLQVRKL